MRLEEIKRDLNAGVTFREVKVWELILFCCFLIIGGAIVSAYDFVYSVVVTPLGLTAGLLTYFHIEIEDQDKVLSWDAWYRSERERIKNRWETEEN